MILSIFKSLFSFFMVDNSVKFDTLLAAIFFLISFFLFLFLNLIIFSFIISFLFSKKFICFKSQNKQTYQKLINERKYE